MASGPHAGSHRGRYQRGEETQQRIIDAAVAMFGLKGFSETSTRDIAAAADINTPAIQYYFENKLGLYTACIDHLTSRIWYRIGPVIEACRAVLSEKPALGDIIMAARTVQDCLIDSFFADSEGLAIRRLKAWSDADSSPDAPGNVAGELLKVRVGLPIFETFRQIVCYVCPAGMSELEIDLHANALVGTSMIFHLDRMHSAETAECSADECGAGDDTFVAVLRTVANSHLAFALTGLAAR